MVVSLYIYIWWYFYIFFLFCYPPFPPTVVTRHYLPDRTYQDRYVYLTNLLPFCKFVLRCCTKPANFSTIVLLRDVLSACVPYVQCMLFPVYFSAVLNLLKNRMELFFFPTVAPFVYVVSLTAVPFVIVFYNQAFLMFIPLKNLFAYSYQCALWS